MERKINIPINGRYYTFTAKSPEDESKIRLAAKLFTERREAYVNKAVQKIDEVELLTIMALNISLDYFKLKEEYNSLLKTINGLNNKLDDYLDK